MRAHPPSGGGSSFKAAKKAALALAHQNCEAAVQTLVNQMGDPDHRVAHMAAVKITELAGLKGVPEDEGGAGALDLAHLSPSDLQELAAAMATVRRLTTKPKGVVIDG